jgi:hypothetical protein
LDDYLIFLNTTRKHIILLFNSDDSSSHLKFFILTKLDLP